MPHQHLIYLSNLSIYPSLFSLYLFIYRREILAFQLECKRRVDSKFKDIGHPRFKQDEIDLKYHSLSLSIDAVKTGDLNLLTESLPHVDVRMAVSLTLVAIERDHIHLMGCLLEKLVRERVFKVRSTESVGRSSPFFSMT